MDDYWINTNREKFCLAGFEFVINEYLTFFLINRNIIFTIQTLRAYKMFSL